MLAPSICQWNLCLRHVYHPLQRPQMSSLILLDTHPIEQCSGTNVPDLQWELTLFKKPIFIHDFLYFSLTAQLLRQSDHHWVPEEDSHILQAAYRCERGDHVWLQVPHWREQNPLFVWHRELQRNPQLKSVLVLPQYKTCQSAFLVHKLLFSERTKM